MYTPELENIRSISAEDITSGILAHTQTKVSVWSVVAKAHSYLIHHTAASLGLCTTWCSSFVLAMLHQ